MASMTLSLPLLPSLPPSLSLSSFLSLSLLKAAFSNPGISADQCAIIIAAVGSILSSLPLSSLTQPLDVLLHSRIDSIQALATGQVSLKCL